MIDTENNQFLTSIPLTSASNGILAIPRAHELWVGLNDSTVAVIDTTTNAVTHVISTGGTARADELAWDPEDGLILIANDRDTPPFVSFISQRTYSVVKKLRYDGTAAPNSTGGIEQPVWDGPAGKFYIAIPATTANPNGEMDEIDPRQVDCDEVFSDRLQGPERTGPDPEPAPYNGLRRCHRHSQRQSRNYGLRSKRRRDLVQLRRSTRLFWRNSQCLCGGRQYLFTYDNPGRWHSRGCSRAGPVDTLACGGRGQQRGICACCRGRNRNGIGSGDTGVEKWSVYHRSSKSDTGDGIRLWEQPRSPGTAPNAQVIEIHVGSPTGALFTQNTNRGSMTTGAWITDGMTFYLQDVTGGLPLTSANTLATAVVHLQKN